MSIWKIYARVFPGTIIAGIFKSAMSCCIVGLILELLILTFRSYFCLFGVICNKVLSETMQSMSFELGMHMVNEKLYCEIETRDHFSYFSVLLSIFHLSPLLHVKLSLKICVRGFSGNIEAAIFKFD